MEKFQIAKYGMMQVTAVLYGILASGVFVRIADRILHDGRAFTIGMDRARFFNNYGFWLLILPVIWTVGISYLISSFSPWNFDPEKSILSGLVLAIILAIISSCFAGAGFSALFAS